jgi:hypothetical protein
LLIFIFILCMLLIAGTPQRVAQPAAQSLEDIFGGAPPRPAVVAQSPAATAPPRGGLEWDPFGAAPAPTNTTAAPVAAASTNTTVTGGDDDDDDDPFAVLARRKAGAPSSQKGTTTAAAPTPTPSSNNFAHLYAATPAVQPATTPFGPTGGVPVYGSPFPQAQPVANPFGAPAVTPFGMAPQPGMYGSPYQPGMAVPTGAYASPFPVPQQSPFAAPTGMYTHA